MHLVAKMDEYGKGAWIALVVLGFWFFWPVGLAALGFIIVSGRTRCWRGQGPGRWYNTASPRGGSFGWSYRGTGSSGNAAFDEYRAETLKRLEDEQKEFVEYLERLRQAKDKQEFDQFMADRKGRSEVV